VTILFACIEIIKAKEIGLKPYMKGFWNKLSMIQLFLCFTMMSIYFDRIFCDMKLSTMDLKLSICAPNSKLPQHENAIKIMLNIKKKYVNCLLAYMATVNYFCVLP
jgi:hypothetical protein